MSARVVSNGSPSVERASLPTHLADAFVELPRDAETDAWLATEGARPHGAWLSTLHRTLRRVASDYDVDGWLGTHPMHLLGSASWRTLLPEPPRGALLDVGAGSGAVTAPLASLFERVVATETSVPMVRRLRARGYEAHRVDLATQPLPRAERFACVSLLNVIDRSVRPRSLLAAARDLLAPGGALVLATPLPLRPHVDVGGHTVDPDEPLPTGPTTFEASLAALDAELLQLAGLAVERWTRASYLARGDLDAPLHRLDDAVLVARVR